MGFNGWSTLLDVVAGTTEQVSETITTPAGVRSIWTMLELTDLHGVTPVLTLGTRIIDPSGGVLHWVFAPTLSIVGNNSIFHTTQVPTGITVMAFAGAYFHAEAPVIPPLWKAYVSVADTDQATYKVSYIYAQS